MKVHGNSKWPTVRWLRQTLAPIQSPQGLAWGVTKPDCIGGQPKLFGLDQLQTLQAALVPTPRFFTTLEEATAALDQHTVIGRKNNHTQGRHITSPIHAEWPNADYWQVWLPPTQIVNEYRVYVAGSSFLGKARTFAFGQKTPETPPPNSPIRSRRFGWVVDFTAKPPKGIRPIARKAIDALGYDFGGVDVLLLASGTILVLEVNSAFALKSPYTRRRFLQTLLFKDPRALLEDNIEEPLLTHLLNSLNEERI